MQEVGGGGDGGMLDDRAGKASRYQGVPPRSRMI